MTEFTTQHFQFSGIETLHFSGPGTIRLYQDGQERLSVSGPVSALERLEIRQEGAKLIIRRKSWLGALRTDASPSFDLHVRSLASAEFSGSVNLFCEALDCGGLDFELSLSGAADVRFQRLNASRLTLHSSGSSTLDIGDCQVREYVSQVRGSATHTVRGSCDNLELDLSGSARQILEEFVCQTAKIAVNGTGRISLHVQDKLDARLRGSSEITYRGSPAVTQQSSGPSRLVRVD